MPEQPEQHDLPGLERTMTLLGAFEPLYQRLHYFTRTFAQPYLAPKQQALLNQAMHSLSIFYQSLLDPPQEEQVGTPPL